jgi:hypothetical protein
MPEKLFTGVDFARVMRGVFTGPDQLKLAAVNLQARMPPGRLGIPRFQTIEFSDIRDIRVSDTDKGLVVIFFVSS